MRSQYPQRGRRSHTILVAAALLGGAAAVPTLSQPRANYWT